MHQDDCNGLLQQDRRDPRHGAGRAARRPGPDPGRPASACWTRASSRWRERAGSSVPTIMRTCRDLGFAGLREFKLALAQELALGGSPLHRRVRIDDDARRGDRQGHAQRRRDGGQRRAGAARHGSAVQAAADAIAAAPHVDCYGAGITSWLHGVATCRRGCSGSACRPTPSPTTTCSCRRPPRTAARGVVIAITHVGGMPSLLEAVDIARAQGATRRRADAARHAAGRARRHRCWR